MMAEHNDGFLSYSSLFKLSSVYFYATLKLLLKFRKNSLIWIKMCVCVCAITVLGWAWVPNFWCLDDIRDAQRFFWSHLKIPKWLDPWNQTKHLSIWHYLLLFLKSSSDFSRFRPTWRPQLSTRSSRPRGNRWGSTSPPHSVEKRVASAPAKPRNEACPLVQPAVPPTAPWPYLLSVQTVRKRYTCR